MTPVWIAFFAGAVIGCAIGLFVSALCMAAGDAERQKEKEIAKRLLNGEI